ncbi:MAG: DNA methylase [Parasporobacterium sp.]|nr:DNA methylase [Parasporobacterium sp.]
MEKVLERTIIAIDLKSYYASVEASDRKYDPLTTNLVVADDSRTEKTICLAVSPSLKAYGISGRARLFEVIQKVKEINRDRFQKAKELGVLPRDEKGRHYFASSSFDAEALAADPSLELSYIIAPPRMRLYEQISTKIFSIYLKFVSAADIHVYSIDECFIDVTAYLNTYRMSAHELAITMIREVLYTTGITATAGIGSNLYLAKIAMDIVAKHVPADKDGVRIAELTEQSYREKLWCHTPLTDFWRVGSGIARRMASLGCFTMGDIARLSLTNEDALYNSLGINAELLIDHAWGWEPTEIKTIKAYRPQTNSLSSGQVLMEPYPFEKARLIVKEMTELLVLDMVRKGVVTKKMELTINYDRTSLQYEREGRTVKDSTFRVSTTGKRYKGTVSIDYYGRPAPKYAHGTANLDHWSSSSRRIREAMTELYDRIVDPDLLVRRVTIAAVNLIPENSIPKEEPEQLSFFVDYEAREKKRSEENAAEEKERKLQKATLALQQRFGKNAVLKGMNLKEGGTTMLRNNQIGGHRAGEEKSERGENNKSEKNIQQGEEL